LIQIWFSPNLTTLRLVIVKSCLSVCLWRCCAHDRYLKFS